MKKKNPNAYHEPILETPDILILGIGNFIMGDEGVGVHVIKELEKRSLPPEIAILDGGTGGFHLMEYLENAKKVIMIDATMDGKPAGSISLIKPRFSSDFPSALSAHDIGLKDMIESLILLEKLPQIDLITVSIEKIEPMKLELSDEVGQAIPEVLDKIEVLLK